MSLRSYSTAVLGAICGLMLAVAPSLAFIPLDGNGVKYEIPLKQFDQYGVKTPATSQAEAQITDALAKNYNGFWKVYSWNSLTGTPSAVYGSGAQVADPFTTEEQVVEAAKRVILTNPDVFKVDLYNLRFDSAPHVDGKWAVHFKQTHRGLEVVGGKVWVTFTDQGRLFVMGSEVYQNITLEPFPSISNPVAQDLAKRALPFNEATDQVIPNYSLVILPVPVTATQVDYRLVWQVKVRTQEPLGLWDSSIDAHSGEIVARTNEISFLDFVGTTSGLVQKPSYCEGQTQMAMPYLRIQVSGVGNATADVNGNWTLPYTGTDAHAVTADLYSAYVDLNNVAGAEGTFTGNATPGTPLQVNFTNLNAQRDEKDCYRAVNDIHTYYLDIDPTYSYTNTQITCNVSRPSTCNAYWDGTINFYAAGGGCANTGEIMGVVQHEFCHGITNNLIGSQGSEGIGEGNSDILSNLMTMDPIIGRGFYLNQCTTGIRNSLNNLVYPDDVVGQEIHAAGQVIAGFHWDAMTALVAAYGQAQGNLITATTWHYGRKLQHPTTQPAQVLATFIADDNDGDLTNGTPHYDQFCLGASNHHFSCPEIISGVIITHTPPLSRTDPGDVTLTATITSTAGPLIADSVRVRYRINGGAFQWMRMNSGAPSQYSATITGLTQPSEVEYYIRARDTVGNFKTAPALAPADLYAFDIANAIDPLETDTGWQVNLEGTDNATTGQWVRVDPIGTTYNGATVQPEDDHTPAPGTICWVTANGTVGGAAGEADVDGGCTTLYSPTYDLTGTTSSKVKYYVWYSNNRGNNPGEDTWKVQVRNNGGAWTDLENTTSATNAWALRKFDLSAMFGVDLGVVQLKFSACDLTNPSLVEAVIDDFELLYANSTDAPLQAAKPLRLALLGSHPNPATAAATIDFQVPTQTEVALKVFDVAGRQVRVLANKSFAPGTHSLSWDGRDDSGRGVPSGVYFYRMQSGAFTSTRTITLTR